jgi:hypothetical protein
MEKGKHALSVALMDKFELARAAVMADWAQAKRAAWRP